MTPRTRIDRWQATVSFHRIQQRIKIHFGRIYDSFYCFFVLFIKERKKIAKLQFVFEFEMIVENDSIWIEPNLSKIAMFLSSNVSKSISANFHSNSNQKLVQFVHIFFPIGNKYKWRHHKSQSTNFSKSNADIVLKKKTRKKLN